MRNFFIFMLVSTIALCNSLKFLMKSSRLLRPLTYNRAPIKLHMSDEKVEETEIYEGQVQDQETETDEESESQEEAPQHTEDDPQTKLIKAKEQMLASQVQQLESLVAAERVNLLRVKDRISESGKNGYFIVQAQVADFTKKRDADQKQKIKANKKEFVIKMLPVIDSFREAINLAPPTTEREENMHKNFGSLLSSLLIVLDKYGYKEFTADIGGKYDDHQHETVGIVEGDHNGIILDTLRGGFKDNDGEVIRKAQVIVTQIPGTVPSESNETTTTDAAAAAAAAAAAESADIPVE